MTREMLDRLVARGYAEINGTKVRLTPLGRYVMAQLRWREARSKP